MIRAVQRKRIGMSSSRESKILREIPTTSRTLLVLLLLTAAALRLYGIDFGLPELVHRDEPLEMNRALELGMGAYAWERAGKGVFYLFEVAQLGIVYVALDLAGGIDSPADFAAFFVAHEPAFYVAARVTSALFGLATIAAVYWLGAKHGGRHVGLLAALAMTFSGLHIANSHYATVDVLLTFLMVCATYYIVGAADSAARRSYVMAGLLSGVALATKLPAIILSVGILAAAAVNVASGRSAWKPAAVNVIVAGAVMVAAAVFFEPGYAVRAAGFLELAGNILGVGAPDYLQSTGTVNPWGFYAFSLIDDVGWPLLAVAIARLVWGTIKGKTVELVSIAVVLPYLILICMVESNLVYDRYLLPILPLTAVVAARGIADTLSHAFRRTNPTPVLRVGASAIAVLVITTSLVVAGVHTAARFGEMRTDLLAMEWMEANAVPGANVLIPGHVEHRSTYLVPIVNSAERMRGVLDELERTVPGKALYLSLQEQHLAASRRPRFDLTLVQHFDAWPQYDSVRKAYDYVVINDHAFAGPVGVGPESKQTRAAFLKRLKESGEFRIVAHFPQSRERFGPTITIFSRDRSVSFDIENSGRAGQNG